MRDRASKRGLRGASKGGSCGSRVHLRRRSSQLIFVGANMPGRVLTFIKKFNVALLSCFVWSVCWLCLCPFSTITHCLLNGRETGCCPDSARQPPRKGILDHTTMEPLHLNLPDYT